MRILGSLVAVVAAFAPTLGFAGDGEAENHLVDAALAYRAKDWDRTLRELEAARAEAESASMKARIERQAGLLNVATDRPVEALQAFRLALALDPEIDLEGWRFGPGVRSLFACAQAMSPEAPRPDLLQSDGARGWICPTPATEAGRADATEAGAADPNPAEIDLEEPPPPPPDEGTGLGALGGVGIGLAVAGVATGVAIGAWQIDEMNAAADRKAELEQGRLSRLRSAAIEEAEAERADAERNAIIAFGAGGAVAAAGVTLLLFDLLDGGDADDRPPSLALPVVVGPGTASLRLRF